MFLACDPLNISPQALGISLPLLPYMSMKLEPSHSPSYQAASDPCRLRASSFFTGHLSHGPKFAYLSFPLDMISLKLNSYLHSFILSSANT